MEPTFSQDSRIVLPDSTPKEAIEIEKETDCHDKCSRTGSYESLTSSFRPNFVFPKLQILTMVLSLRQACVFVG